MNENSTDIVFNDEEQISLPENTHIDFDFLDVDGKWVLKVISGANTGAEFAMQGDSSYLLGTDASRCDILFQDVSISRQHAKISIDNEDRLFIEDLQSTNGTFVNGERIEKMEIEKDTLISIGTTSLLLFNKEKERTTIIASLAQKEPLASATEEKTEENKEEEAEEKQIEEASNLREIHNAILEPIQAEVERAKKRQKEQLAQAKSSLGMLSIVTIALLTIGIGTVSLFKTEDVKMPYVAHPEKEIQERISEFPSIRFSYNPVNNRLLLVGHVLTSVDRSHIIDMLQQLKFISNIDYSNIIIDELVYKEINQILAKDPEWRSISISSPTAGRYLLNGFLKSKEQADRLYDYLSHNFPYVDLLEKNVLVEEELARQITQQLQQAGIKTVQASITNGETWLRGSISNAEKEKFSQVVEAIKVIPGVRDVQLQVEQTGSSDARIDISSKYRTTGYSQKGSFVSVVINGRILSAGDSIDGMNITAITPSTVLLERGGMKYKIDFNR